MYPLEEGLEAYKVGRYNTIQARDDMNLGQGGDDKDGMEPADVRRSRRERESLDPSPGLMITSRFAILTELP